MAAMIERLQLATELEPLQSMQHPRGVSVLKLAAAFEGQAKGKWSRKHNANGVIACQSAYL